MRYTLLQFYPNWDQESGTEDGDADLKRKASDWLRRETDPRNSLNPLFTKPEIDDIEFVGEIDNVTDLDFRI